MITFRPIERTDLPLLKEWRNSELVRPYVREYRMLNDSDQEAWYNSYLSSRHKADFDQEIYIIECDGDEKIKRFPIAVGGFTRIEWRNQRAELTYYTSPVLAKDAPNYDLVVLANIKKLLVRGFYEFNFNKITWPVYAHDQHLELYQSIFKTETMLKEEYYWDGKFQDRIYLSLLKKDFLSLDK